jgi:hypothetical protein
MLVVLPINSSIENRSIDVKRVHEQHLFPQSVFLRVLAKKAVTTATTSVTEVKRMAKFLSVWRYNLNAPWPTDPTESEKINETLLAATDNLLKAGEFQEFGFFPDGMGGYAISTGESKDMLRRAWTLTPLILSEVHEIVPYETGKEVMRAFFKAQAEQVAAIK